MKKTIQAHLFTIACCLLTCLFFSCHESVDQIKTAHHEKDSTTQTIEEFGTAAVKGEETETQNADSLVHIINEKFSTLAQVNRRLNKRASYFVIKTNRDTVIKCKEGTLLSIPADAFLSAANNSPVSEVKISVKEFYKISDMIVQGLTTTSNNQLLETGGMINIKVTGKDKNDSCVLKPGKNITIALASPDSGNVQGMQLFNGTHDDAHMNWTPRPGIAGLAQSWRFGYNNLPQDLLPLNAGFIFPDDIIKNKPEVINSKPENLRAEVKMSIRELMQHVGVVTKKASAFIDTSGNLNCYKFASVRKQISFPGMYEPTTSGNMKVCVGVEVNLSYQSDLNRSYHEKLFKMGKGNPDSLVAITVTLNPVVKLISFEKIKKYFANAQTVKEFRKKERRHALLVQEYEKKMQQLRLQNENNLVRSESNSTTNLQSAQNYLLLSTSKLGWINCDRFYDAPSKIDYLVRSKEKASVRIVFNSIRSIMSSGMDGVYHNVPLNEKITIVGLKTENGKLMMAQHETRISEEPFEGLSFKPVTIKEYKEKLEKLNRL